MSRMYMRPEEATRISFDEAIAEALRLEMHRDAAVVSFFTSTTGVAARLADAFADERTIRTAAIGAPLILAACGAAQEGLRPVCELALDDAGPSALEQLAEIAVAAAGADAPTPITVRLEIGDPLASGGAAGSDPLAFLLGRRGLKVVEPSTAADAKGLTVAALRDDDPVCILEHASLRAGIGTVPEGGHIVEIGRARLVTEGERLTMLAHGPAVALAEQAIEAAALDADLLDLRTLEPLDAEAILTSVRKTGKVVIVEPGGDSDRVSVTLAGMLWERGFEYLDGPTRRVRLSGPGTNGYRRGSDIERIAIECDELLGY